MGIFEYMYYRLYAWNLRKWKKSDYPEGNALIGVSFVMSMNVALVLLVLEYAGVIRIMFGEEHQDHRKVLAISIYVISLLISYFHFCRKKKYRKLVQKYAHESKKERFWKTLILWLFFLFSLFSGYILVYLMKN
ncbi:hypothetical protein [Porphyromonas gulae]|nr:hypothetical protein [Porphyromonas gulae]KKC50447.1 hypothetical protein HR10_09440 [Porphyromonas gulae]